MEYTNEQKNKRHQIKKQINRLVDQILKQTAIASNPNYSAAMHNQAEKIVARKEKQLNELWFEYNRFIPGVK